MSEHKQVNEADLGWYAERDQPTTDAIKQDLAAMQAAMQDMGGDIRVTVEPSPAPASGHEWATIKGIEGCIHCGKPRIVIEGNRKPCPNAPNPEVQAKLKQRIDELSAQIKQESPSPAPTGPATITVVVRAEHVLNDTNKPAPLTKASIKRALQYWGYDCEFVSQPAQPASLSEELPERYKREKAALVKLLGLPEKVCMGEILIAVQGREERIGELERVIETKNATMGVQLATHGMTAAALRTAESHAVDLAAKLEEATAMLRWLDILGGLGLDKHERIRTVLSRLDSTTPQPNTEKGGVDD